MLPGVKDWKVIITSNTARCAPTPRMFSTPTFCLCHVLRPQYKHFHITLHGQKMPPKKYMTPQGQQEESNTYFSAPILNIRIKYTYVRSKQLPVLFFSQIKTISHSHPPPPPSHTRTHKAWKSWLRSQQHNYVDGCQCKCSHKSHLCPVFMRLIPGCQ